MNLRYLPAMALLVLVGCAHDPAPVEQMRLSSAALERAQAAGANESNPSLQAALAKFARAEKNMAEQDYKRARVLAEQAELDARLAEAQVLSENSVRQVEALRANISSLLQQLGAQGE